jgi:Tetratricopeptide repeat
MKSKITILATVLLISVTTFAQDAEFKVLRKIFEKEVLNTKDIAEFKIGMKKAEQQDANFVPVERLYYEFYKSFVPYMELKIELQKPENVSNREKTSELFKNSFTSEKAVELVTNMNKIIDYEKTNNKPLFAVKIQNEIEPLKNLLFNFAIDLGNNSKFKESSLVLRSIYDLDKKETEKLYYAANYALNAKEYNIALTNYQELKTLNYSGETTNFYAVNKANDRENQFKDKKDRDDAVKLGTHEKSRDEKIESKRGEIYRNIALILRDKGKTSEAIKAISDARIANPDDSSLLMEEANMYYKMNDLVSYKRLIKEALEKNPNDKEMLFNLGVISRNANEKVESEKYYRSALAIDPNYEVANINLAELLMSSDDEIIKRMEAAKDPKKYDIIKKERENNFKKVIPFLEKVMEVSPSNKDVKTTLISVYNALDMTDKAKALKNKQ